MSIPLLRACALIVSCVLVNPRASGAESHACAGVIDPTERLVCYDRAFPPASGARSGGVDLEAERAKALRDFGLNKVQLSEREPERIRNISPERIEAKVVRVTPRPTGERVVALDNGQIWLLTEVTSKGRLRAGDPIAVRVAALGSYMLVTPGKIALRARRIK